MAVAVAGLTLALSLTAQARRQPDGVLAGANLPFPVVITQLPVGGAWESPGSNAGAMTAAPYGDGARLLLVRSDFTTRSLTGDFHSAAEASLSFAGDRLLFAGKKSADDLWNIYELTLETGETRQITRDMGNCRTPIYLSLLYTIVTNSNWRPIAFISDLEGAWNEATLTRATSLYSCQLDGTGLQRLSFNPSSDTHPFLQDNGRILFASWQRISAGRGPMGRVGLFGINLDGTDYALYTADQGRQTQRMACETRQGLVVFIESDQAPWDGAGQVGAVSIRRPLHTHRALTAEVDGVFHSPSPLADGRVLISRRPADGSAPHGVYALTPETGQYALFYDDPRYHDIHAIAVQPRPRPDGRASAINADKPTGQLYCLDVRISDLPRDQWAHDGMAQRVRLLEGLPLMVGQEGQYRADEGGLLSDSADSGAPPLTIRATRRRLLGEVPVGDDGSFAATIPAAIPIQVQLLDADGLALRSSAWIWAMNNEPRGCIGCHEDPELTPRNTFTEAMGRAIPELTLPPEQRRTVDYRHQVAPIVERHCVRCHSGPEKSPRLEGGDDDGPFSPAYRSLLAPAPGDEGTQTLAGGRYVHPGQARTSPLAWRVFGRNLARPWDGEIVDRPAPRRMPLEPAEPLSDEEKRVITEWIDMGALWDATWDAEGQ